MTRLCASFFITCALALSLALGAMSHAAVAPGQERGDLQAVVICADGHEAVIYVDADGRPADPDDYCHEFGCADCPRTAAALTPTDPSLPGDPLAAPHRTRHAADQVLVAQRYATALARAPPERD